MGCGSSHDVANQPTERKAPIERPADTAHSVPESKKPLQQKDNKENHEDDSGSDDENYFDDNSPFQIDEEDAENFKKMEAERIKQLKEAASPDEGKKEKKKKAKNPIAMAAELRKKYAKKFKSDDPFWNAFHLMHGNPYIEFRSNDRLVRVFTSSTFADTKVERNALMVDAYPALKVYCQKRGYEFQIVDMRWGIRGEAEDDHMTVDMCMKEIYACQKVSTGPNFVTFLSHRYGFQPIPRLIEQKEFETITSSLSVQEKDILYKWYRLDENNVPPSYLLQPISLTIPDYISPHFDVYIRAKKEWDHYFKQLREALIRGVEANIRDKEKNHNYHIAVTEQEIREGILNAPNSKKSAFWFHREFTDLDEEIIREKNEEEEKKSSLGRFWDGGWNPAAIPLMRRLVKDQLPAKLHQNNIKTYPLKWSRKGVNPDIPEHRRYVEQLVEDFRSVMEGMIDAGIQERLNEEINDPLYLEIVQHVNFCQNKAITFNGRDNILSSVSSYLKDEKRETPLIIHGESGTGKTSVLAMVANLVWDWLDGKGVVIYRFLGTTASSSALQPLLFSIVEQLIRVYVDFDKKPEQELKYLVEDFKEMIKRIPDNKPLVLILDSLDQLDNSDGGHNLHWLPRKLPANCKIILSTIPDEKYGILSRLKGLYKDEASYLAVERMKTSEVDTILDLWLTKAGRRLTQDQLDILIAAYNLCPTPLFLKLSFDEALRWHSYDDIASIRGNLQVTVTATINQLLERVERCHGRMLVSFALGSITATRNGLTESELEDLISLNDEVLNDVYQYQVPPQRRLPPLLWVRIRYDLQEYMVNRGIDGVRVINWYHRQFIETSRQRYLSDPQDVQDIHMALSEYFMGIWADVPKPYISKKGEEKAEKRYVARQPLQLQDKYNLRKLKELPYHLTYAGDVELLKQQTICNYEFLLTKLKASSFSAVIMGLKRAAQVYPEDQEIALIKEALQLSQDALQNNSNELAGQLVGRIHSTGSQTLIGEAKEMLDKGTLPAEAVEILNLLEAFTIQHQNKQKNIVEMLKQAKESTTLSLLPHCGFLTPPGGQLLHKVSGHTDILMDMDLSQNGNTVVTGSFDKTVKLWDIQSGEMLHSLDFPEKVNFVRFCHNERSLVVSCWGKLIHVVEIATATILFEIQGPSSSDDLPELAMKIAVCTQPSELLATMRNSHIEIYNLQTGTQVISIENFLEDWSIYQKGLYMEHRHFLSHNNMLIYAGYRGSEYFVVDMNNLSEDGCDRIDVFDTYDFEKECEDPDFTPKSYDHIGAMAITGIGNQVLICNGANNNLIFFDINTGDKQRIIQFKGNAKLRYIYFPPNANWFYFGNMNDVGTMNLATNDAKSLLPHNCVVYKVMGGASSRCVATIAEDSVLRIWDKTMEDYTADISHFTGKVKVSSKKAAETALRNFTDMFSQITGSTSAIPDASDILTTEDIANYWTKDERVDEFEELVTAKVRPCIYPLSNPLYVAVVHSHINLGYAFCFSIWELRHMNCVRRMFFPHGDVHAYMVVNDSHLVISENRRLKLLELDNLKQRRSFPGKMCKRHNPVVHYNALQNVIVTETRGGNNLKVYDVATYTTKGILQMPPDISREKSRARRGKIAPSLFNSLQVNKNGSLVGVCYGRSQLFVVWSLKSLQYLYTINPRGNLVALPSSGSSRYNFTFSTDGLHLVVSRDDHKVFSDPKDKTKSTSCVLLNAETGSRVGHVNPHHKVNSLLLTVKSAIPIIRHFRRRKLQIVAVGSDNKGHYVSETVIGKYTTHIKTNIACDRIIVWSNLPRERAISYYSFESNQLKLLGTFTTDKANGDVAMVDHGHTLLVDSSGGLMKLQLHGKDIQPPDDTAKESAEHLFPGVQLNVPFVAGIKVDDEKEDLDDLDKDQD